MTSEREPFATASEPFATSSDCEQVGGRMNISELNAKIEELTVATKPEKRKTVIVRLDDVVVRLVPVGDEWAMSTPVGDSGVATMGFGRKVMFLDDWGDNDVVCLFIGTMKSGGYDIKGFVTVPSNAKISAGVDE